MRLATALILALVTTACAHESLRRTPPSGVPASMASDPDTTTLGDDCLACHGGDLIRQQRLTDTQWAKTLERMRTWGAPTEDDGVAPLLSHLVSTGGRDAGAFVPLTISAADAASLFARQPNGALSGGDKGRGSTLYADRCSPCHADDAMGGTMGVALAGRHVLDRASDLAAIIRAGRGRMPGFEDTTDAEVADILAYLRSLPGR